MVSLGSLRLNREGLRSTNKKLTRTAITLGPSIPHPNLQPPTPPEPPPTHSPTKKTHWFHNALIIVFFFNTSAFFPVTFETSLHLAF